MVTIVGNIKPEDDFTHPLGPEKNFNESVYFNFFDPKKATGGFIRMGNRANEGYAEMTIMIFCADGSVFFNYKKPEIDNNDAWDAGGAEVQVIKAGDKIRTSYSGSALLMADPRDMKDPGKAFKSNPFKTIELDLLHFGVGPMYGHVGEEGDGNDFARAHYEQHMRVEGTLAVEGQEPLMITGNGLRDHSWGPRYWQSAKSYRWITGNFGDDLGFAMTVSAAGAGGGVQSGDKLTRITKVELKTDYEDGSSFHRALRADISLEDGGNHRIEGKVKGFIPLRNRRSEAVTYIGEGMTEYVLDGDRVGYGLAEYLNNPGDDLD